MALNKYVQAAYSETKDNASGSRASNLNRFVQSAYSSDRINYLLEQSKPSPVVAPKPKATVEANPVKPTASTVLAQGQYRPNSPYFTPNIVNPNASQNNTLFGKATGDAVPVKKDFDFAGTEKRMAELEDKIARMQNDPSTEAVRSKQTELLVYRTQYEGLKKDYEKAKADKWYTDTGKEISDSMTSGNNGLYSNLKEAASLYDIDMAERMALNAPGVGPLNTNVQDELNAAKAKLPAGVDADWLEYARHANEREAFDKSMEEARAYAETHPVGSSVASVPLNLMGGAGGVDVLGKKIGKMISGSEAPINFQSAAMIPSAAAQEIRSTVSEDMSATGSMLYNVGMSIADSAAIIGASAFGIPGGSALLGSSAATSTMRAASERGASENQAIVLGLIAGAAEAFFEKYSIDNLLTPNGAKGAKAFFENFFKQGVTEMTEEGATTLANTAADFLIMGDKSELAQRKQKLIADGYSEEEANRIAGTEWVKNFGVDLLGGLISGGFFSTAKSAAGGISNAATKTDSRYNEMVRDINSFMPRLPQEQSAASQTAQEAAVPNAPNTAPTETNVAQGTADDAVSAVLPNVADHRDTAAQILNDGIFDSPTYGEALEETGMKRSDVRQALRKIAQNTPGADADAEVRAVVNAIVNAEAQPQTQTTVEPEAVETAQEVPAAETQQTVETEQPETAEANHGVGDIGDMGAKTSDFPHKVKESRSKTTPRYYEQNNIPEEGRADNHYTERTWAEARHNARQSLEQDYGFEIEDLKRKTVWSDEDVFKAEVILEDLRQEAESTKNWDDLREWSKVFNQHKEELGRAFSALRGIHRTNGETILANASEALEDAKAGTDTNAVMNTVSEYSKRFDVASDTKNLEELVQIIRETSATRKTNTRKGGLHKEIDWALDRLYKYASAEMSNARQTDAIEPAPPIQNYTLKTGDRVTVSDRDNIGTIVSVNDDGTYTVHFKSRQGHEATKTFTGDMVKKLGQKKTAITYPSSTSDVGKFYDFLRNFAANGIEAIATDKQRVSFGAGYRTIQHNSILSKFVTVARNLVSNGVLDPLDSFAGNLAVPVDALLSKFTKTRSVAFDKSWFSEAKRKGSMDGLAMALLEIGLDVNSDGTATKYEDVGKRTFHMSNGGIAKLISTWEKYSGYLMTATDEFSKGGVEAEVQRGIDSLYEQNKIKDDTLRDAGEQAARYRTLQDETMPSKVVTGIRRAVNNIHVGDLGLGDVAIKFAQVPANIPARVADFSPLGLTRGIGKLAKVMWDAKHGNLTAAQQASAVKDIGRGITGTGMIIAATAMALKGIIHVVAPGGEDENKNKAASEAAQGLKEVQLNLSSLLRSVKGEDTTFRPDDKLVSIGFLDPINAHLMTGALIAEDIEEARKAGEKIGFGDVTKDSLQGVVHSVWNLPLMDPIKDIYYALQKSDGDNFVDKGFDVANAAIAGEVASFVPNALKGIAQGIDPYQRDFYTKDTLVGQTVDSIIGGIPFVRETLPTKQDVYGDDIKNPNQPLNFLNANVLPGSVTTYTETELQAALNALSEETGSYSMYLSKKPPASITNADGDKIKLTNKQQRQFMTERGDLYEAASAALEADETYKDFSGEWKLKAYEYAKEYVTQKAKESLDTGFEPETWVSDLEGATPEEFSEALVQRVVESMAKKAGENKLQGMGNLLSDQSIDDQIALSLMSKEASDAYTAFTEVMNVPVQQFLDIYGTATAASEKADEQYAAAMERIQNMDISAYDKSALEFGAYYSMMMGKKLREKYNTHVKGGSISNSTYMDAAKYYDAYKAEEHGGVERSEAMFDYVVSVCPNMTAAKTLFLGFFAESTWEEERSK